MEKQDEFKPDEIENKVCKKIEKAKVFPMSNELASILVKLMLARESINIPEKEKPFLYSLIEKRIEYCFTYKATSTLILFLVALSERPGTAVMYLWYLQYIAKTRNIKEFTLGIFCEIFPWGFPNEETLHEIWEGQKTGRNPQNLVDCGAAGQSLI